jgi:hypothetical protein
MLFIQNCCNDLSSISLACFYFLILNSYCPIKQKLSQLKIVNKTIIKVLSIPFLDQFACMVGLLTCYNTNI